MAGMKEILAARNAERMNNPQLNQAAVASGMASPDEGFLRKAYSKVRDGFTRFALNAGGVNSHASHKDYFHKGGNAFATELLSRMGAPDVVAAGLPDAAYIVNELATGTMAVPDGRPFVSEYGFNPEDLKRNRVGQVQGLLAARAKREAMDKAVEEAKRVTGVDPYQGF